MPPSDEGLPVKPNIIGRKILKAPLFAQIFSLFLCTAIVGSLARGRRGTAVPTPELRFNPSLPIPHLPHAADTQHSLYHFFTLFMHNTNRTNSAAFFQKPAPGASIRMVRDCYVSGKMRIMAGSSWITHILPVSLYHILQVIAMAATPPLTFF